MVAGGAVALLAVPAITAALAPEAMATGGAAAVATAQRIPDQLHRFHHIFDNQARNLGALVESLGSQKAAFKAVEIAAQAAAEAQKSTSVFKVTLQVAGTDVVVKGNVIDASVALDGDPAGRPATAAPGPGEAVATG